MPTLDSEQIDLANTVVDIPRCGWVGDQLIHILNCNCDEEQDNE